MMLRVIACRLLDLPLLTAAATTTATTAVATAGRVTTVLAVVR
jgi:hypothetical protein